MTWCYCGGNLIGEKWWVVWGVFGGADDVVVFVSAGGGDSIKHYSVG